MCLDDVERFLFEGGSPMVASVALLPLMGGIGVGTSGTRFPHIIRPAESPFAIPLKH